MLGAVVRGCVFAFAACCASAHSANTLVPPGSDRYAASGFPDRIVAVPAADPSTALSIAWRTDTTVPSPVLQLAEAQASPDLTDRARELPAESRELKVGNRQALHHQVRIDGLRPDTLYAYRVQGKDTWSEWFHIRTATRGRRAFSFLYFGDAQNSVKSLYSRVLREAWRREPEAALMVHAGDLVNGRADQNDDEWGEWFEAGGFLHASSFVVPAPGNHEYDSEGDGEDERYTLGSHWAAQFPVPDNGAPGLTQSTYYFDYQGVRFIVLDSTSALKSDSALAQAQWFEPLLQHNPNRWTIVTYHHPMVSASWGRDNPPLRGDWMPLFERYGVDLVLQGHDHVYGRGANFGVARAPAAGTQVGPVYIVSVAGPKQYRISEEARRAMTRLAENAQLYQVVRVDDEALRYESWTAAGELNDAFELTKNLKGEKRLVDRAISAATRRCPHERTRSGRTDRCWDGTEW